jgi:hypothetical protein
MYNTLVDASGKSGSLSGLQDDGSGGGAGGSV